MFFIESLELLPHLANLGFIPLPLEALRGRSLLGLGQRLLEGRHLSCGPYNNHVNLVIFLQLHFYVFFVFSIRYLLPSFSSSCRLARPSSCSDHSRPCFSVPISAVSAAVASSEACIHILTLFLLDSCEFY